MHTYYKEYANRNKDTIRQKYRDRKKNDPVFKLECNVRSRVYQGLKHNTKSSSIQDIIGCSFEQLKAHLEKQFNDKMSWENYGTYWHLDHIKPISLFDLANRDQLHEAFNYMNCQPLEAKENLKKSNKYEHSIQEES